MADAITVQGLLDQPLEATAWKTLAPLANETSKAHAAFLEYVQMGPGRSIRTLYAKYCERIVSGSSAEKPPTKRLVTLFTWSTKYDWQARLAAYSEERDRAAVAQWEARRQALREIDFQTGDELRDLAADILAETPQFLKTTRRLIKGRDGATDREIITVSIDIDAMLKALKLASDLQRAAADMPAPARDVKVSGLLEVKDLSVVPQVTPAMAQAAQAALRAALAAEEETDETSMAMESGGAAADDGAGI